MPRVHGIDGPYRFFFYSFDCNEPMHVHVRRERATCKFWLSPTITLADDDGFSPRELNRIREIRSPRPGMSTAVGYPTIQTISVTSDEIIAHLRDGRTISVPLAWSWRLSEATPAQRSHFELIGSGEGVHWPDIDEDISVRGMLEGVPARRPGRAA